MAVEFSRGDGPTLVVGEVLPGRKLPALAVQEGVTYRVLGYFRGESERDSFVDALSRLLGPFVVDQRPGAGPPGPGPKLIVQGGRVIGVVTATSEDE